MEIQKINFRNHAYVEWVKQSVYPQVPILAIQKGTIEGCWESLIGAQLHFDCSRQNPAAFETMKELGFDKFDDDVWYLAGEMILNNQNIVL